MEKIGFRPSGEAEIPYREYLKEYVVITRRQGGSFVGKYIGISEEGNMVFNPHDSSDYVGNRFKKIVQKRDKQISPELVGEIEISSRENLEGYCRYVNLNEIREEQKRENEALENVKKLFGNVREVLSLKQ